MIKVSIIVPVYNTGQYLSQCIDSILVQTFTNFELILINDGSTDNSLAICEKYRKMDNRVRVISQKNSGVAFARNNGLKVARGEFIEFIDSDDFIGTHHLQNLVNCQKKYQADIATSTFYRIDENGLYYFYTDNNNPKQTALNGLHKPLEWLQQAIKYPINISAAVIDPVCKLYRKSLFKNIEYPLNRHNGEDVHTTWKLILSANKIVYTNIDDYCYRMNNQSSTSVRNYQNDLWGDQNVIDALEERIAILNILRADISFPKKREEDLLQNVKSIGEQQNSKAAQVAKFKLDMMKKYN